MPPGLDNQFDSDPLLRRWLRWRLPAGTVDQIEPRLERLGQRVVEDVAAAAADAESHPPVLRHYDAWGRRVDRIETSAGWRRLREIAAEEGIVATAYEAREGEFSRAHQFARLYLFHPSSALYSCPLAMTDGAARVLTELGDDTLRDRALRRLVARDPAEFWTSGQWMTEKSGGSDVSGTGTVARRSGAEYRLDGQKWFSSAADSDMALTLARHDDRAGLSLFYLETRRTDGSLNGIRIDRLKDKLGTRAMATAELTLTDVPARLVGEPGRGVLNIAGMLNVTRLYNAVCAIGSMRRGLALARDYARRRKAFGRPLLEHTLHRATLARLEAWCQGAFHLVFYLGLLLGREEAGTAGASDRTLLRLMTPVAKLFTARLAVDSASEVLECFGGAGYIEDTGLPKLLRDAQVMPIWEGTTNVLSLDVLRVLQKSDARAVFLEAVHRRIDGSAEASLAGPRDRLRAAAGRIAAPAEIGEADAREVSFGLARVFAGSLLLEHAGVEGSAAARAALDLWTSGTLLKAPPDCAAAEILARGPGG